MPQVRRYGENRLTCKQRSCQKVKRPCNLALRANHVERAPFSCYHQLFKINRNAHSSSYRPHTRVRPTLVRLLELSSNSRSSSVKIAVVWLGTRAIASEQVCDGISVSLFQSPPMSRTLTEHAEERDDSKDGNEDDHSCFHREDRVEVSLDSAFARNVRSSAVAAIGCAVALGNLFGCAGECDWKSHIRGQRSAEARLRTSRGTDIVYCC